MKKIRFPLALVLAAVSLTGCGLKGPLYFPKDETAKPQVQQATPTTPSATSEQTPATTRGQSVQPAQ
ncbi:MULTISPECIES: LPS translocon maturation chaperone LptM [Erwinia]|uniref:LPS-assembly lipoprotein LptM n=1 Tax=Erwinia rhapontici TaxID=55212 RepID=A0ABN6DQU5_ERWRD|nr:MULTISPECIES: lipoprotein [Erwinia]MBP2153132.1 putative small lipoprotein YifL [Erwinia rhapontici]MCS3609845.1 putative small lipoprotein YifL [Erwinia rhapontici]NKG32690.1 hypothetical protein [Erwinia rhapontici]NNS09850.1 hypothetical protein [Erwinia sp. JH02]TDS89591.1 putative small lipoprotein YifL [Erwinia rhapontici]